MDELVLLTEKKHQIMDGLQLKGNTLMGFQR